LHLPDFRAAERTFQLLAQVAGRTGRGERGGKVMIQTFTPDHPSINLAATHDYLKFAELELAHRKEHLYPPYQRLVRLIIRSQDEGAAQTFADTLAGAFREALKRADRQPPQSPGLRLLGSIG
jgi:primosomal protein N' (replication factor Y) (superfamily II helicase)